MSETSRPVSNWKQKALDAIRVTPSASQVKALELFRSYLTDVELEELDRKQYISFATPTQEFRISPHGRNGIILWRRSKTWKRRSPNPVCVNYGTYPPADAALTVLLLLRSGGYQALREQIRGAVNIGLSD